MDENNKHGNPVRVAFQKLFKNKLATICFVVLILEIILVVLAPAIAPYGYDDQDPSIRLRPGSCTRTADGAGPENLRMVSSARKRQTSSPGARISEPWHFLPFRVIFFLRIILYKKPFPARFKYFPRNLSMRWPASLAVIVSFSMRLILFCNRSGGG